MSTAYKTVSDIAGPLLMVEGVEGVTYDELCEIEMTDGSKRLGKVLESREGLAVVQLFESAQGATTHGTKVRFLGRTFELPVSEDMLGRIFDGSGNPLDDGPAIVPEKKLDINGAPINPASRESLKTLFKQVSLLSMYSTLSCEDKNFLSSLEQVFHTLNLQHKLRGRHVC